MASTTTNLGLTKPAYTDSADVAVINSNMDILDTKIGAIGNTSVASQIGTLSEQIANLDGSKVVTVSNFNDLTTTGIYKAQATTNPLNPPDNNAPTRWYNISVWATPSYVTQLAQSVESGSFFTRAYYSATGWTAWQHIATNGDIIATPSTGSSVTGHAIINGTGNIRDVPRFYTRGNLLTIFGRVVIDSFSKTGSSPGLSFTVPNSKTLDAAVNTYSGIVFDGNGLRIGENAIIQGAANGTTISITTSETYTNVGSGRFGFILNPFNVLIK